MQKKERYQALFSYSDNNINKEMEEIKKYKRQCKNEIIKSLVKKELYKVNQKINKTL